MIKQLTLVERLKLENSNLELQIGEYREIVQELTTKLQKLQKEKENSKAPVDQITNKT
jgi:predicted RNase H-like nuclease (RuvC/YqgF family)